MTADEIADQCWNVFTRLVKDAPQETYWEAAEILSSYCEGPLMERSEICDE